MLTICLAALHLEAAVGALSCCCRWGRFAVEAPASILCLQRSGCWRLLLLG